MTDWLAENRRFRIKVASYCRSTRYRCRGPEIPSLGQDALKIILTAGLGGNGFAAKLRVLGFRNGVTERAQFATRCR